MKTKPTRDIEDPLERWDASFARFNQIEDIRQKKRLYQTVIRLNVGIISILCAVYAIYMQF